LKIWCLKLTFENTFLTHWELVMYKAVISVP